MNDYDLLFWPAEYLADFLGCSVRTARRYKSFATPLPEPCRRLLRLRYYGDLAAMLGKAWEGFYVGHKDGLLYVPGYRNGMNPGQIKAMFFGYQELSAHRQDVKRLKSEVWAMRKVNEAGRSGEREARLQQHAAALRVLSEAIASELDGQVVQSSILRP